MPFLRGEDRLQRRCIASFNLALKQASYVGAEQPTENCGDVILYGLPCPGCANFLQLKFTVGFSVRRIGGSAGEP